MYTYGHWLLKVMHLFIRLQHKKSTKWLYHKRRNYMTNSEMVYKTVIIGGGPAGIGVFIRAARTGFLPRLLNPAIFGTANDKKLSTQLGFKQMGVAVLHAGNAQTFGSGSLGEYIINSNTFASSLLSSVLDEKPDWDPPESTQNTFLEKVRAHESVSCLNKIGAAPGTLTEIGGFLRHVGTCLIEEIASTAPGSSQILLNTTATKYQVVENGLVRMEGRNASGDTIILYTEHLVLATGGSQELPTLEKPEYQSKLFASDSCLRQDGFGKFKDHLLALPPKERKVCIVGGSHSSFSVAWLLLNKFASSQNIVGARRSSISEISPKNSKLSDFKRKMEENANVVRVANVKTTASVTPFETTVAKVKRSPLKSTGMSASSTKVSSILYPADITILHRSPIRCYYSSKKEAEADGADSTRVDRAGCVNTFTGLREDAKRLFKSVRSGYELRVRLIQVNQQASNAIVDKTYATAGAIVWGAGYKTNIIPGFDEGGNPLVFRQDNGVIKLDNKARLQLLGPYKGNSPSIFGIGLGFSLRSAVDEMGAETRVDGVTIYHRRGASLILEALFGPEVYGTSTTFEEMVEKNEKKKRMSHALKLQNTQKSELCPSKSQGLRRSSIASARCSPVNFTSTTSSFSYNGSTVVIRRGQSNPSTPTAASDKQMPKKDIASTNPPVKLLLLRRRAPPL